MFKTIALTAVGALLAAATPALAGPGIVFQGTSSNGIKLQVASVDGVALRNATQPQQPPAPKLPAFDDELAGKPVKTACWTCGGITFNGVSFNGIKLQGVNLNGVKLQGRSLNGRNFNGRTLNGTTTGGPVAEREARFNVRAVTLPGGKRIVVR